MQFLPVRFCQFEKLAKRQENAASWQKCVTAGSVTRDFLPIRRNRYWRIVTYKHEQNEQTEESREGRVRVVEEGRENTYNVLGI